MKKTKAFSLILAILLLVAFVVPALSSCGKDAGTLTLNVYNWGEYISDGSEESFNTNA